MNVVSNTMSYSSVSSSILWLVLAVAIIIFFVMAWIFLHHWKYYGIQGNPKVFAKTLFWVVSVTLIFVMLFSVIGFESI